MSIGTLRLGVGSATMIWSAYKNSFARTIGNILVETNGIGRGFDLLRIGLALLILYGHCVLIASGGLPS